MCLRLFTLILIISVLALAGCGSDSSDDENPTITCPADVSVNTDPGSDVATGVALGNPTTDDNDGVAFVSNDAPASFSIGDTVVNWTVTDSAGNTATCTQTVTVSADVKLELLEILVTNDDGIGAPGIDTLVNALSDMDAVEVVVIAPDGNKSMSSDSTTTGGVTWESSVTASGYEGIAVDGFPADCVIVALDELGITPDMVVSGVNAGENVGPFVELSGTVGAARTAARKGIPAVAVSAGLNDSGAGFSAAAELIVEWIEDNRDALTNDLVPTDVVVNFNVPNCTAGKIRELVTVPLADAVPEGANVFFTDCSLEPDSPPTNDVDAMIKGYAAVTTDVPLDFD